MVEFEIEGPVCTITMNRPDKRNAVDGPMADALRLAFTRFESDAALRVAVLCGAGSVFCAGADLHAVADPQRRNELTVDGSGLGPMGPTRMALSKPLIAAINGFAVAGGLELALQADMRVADEDAVFGVFCRRWGVPLIDGGTVRLPRLIGQSRALDMILTGRAVGAMEAFAMGLANRVVPKGEARTAAQALAHEIAKFPQACLRGDRLSVYEQFDLAWPRAMAGEFAHGMNTLASGESREGAARFAAGHGRGGRFDDP